MAHEYEWLGDLDEAAAYPDDASAQGEIRRVDTHISHVFLTGARAYKLRRPVSLAFLDFTSAAERLADCLREVALNRRLAPDVYLGVAPVLAAGKSVCIGPIGENPSADPDALEHCVVMRRLKAGRDLLSMLERDAVTPLQIDRIAVRLALFHAGHSLGQPAPWSAEDWLACTTAPARANFDALAGAPPQLAPPAQVERARQLACAFAEARRDDFEARRAAGRIVDGHGDLHCEHVWFEHDEDEPLMVDCLEFREDFRRIDAASDAAFLAMDLAYRERPDLAARFLRRYAQASGDYHLFSVIDYFLSYRALVRAKVASLRATDASMSEEERGAAAVSVRRHLDLGLDFLDTPGRGCVMITCGSIGTGKSTVAEALADANGGVVISSDRLRRDSGDTAREPAGYGQDRYSDAARAAVYEQLLEQAGYVVDSGRVAILDATFSRRAWRDAAARWAQQRGCEASLVEVVAPRDAVLARLAAREEAAASRQPDERRQTPGSGDASEAGPGLYDAMRAEFEDPVEWPAARLVRIDTSRPDWREQAAAAARRLAPGRAPFPFQRIPR
ncbi:MAG: AAA family ATPase [Candidatus Binatia bacterium]